MNNKNLTKHSTCVRKGTFASELTLFTCFVSNDFTFLKGFEMVAELNSVGESPLDCSLSSEWIKHSTQDVNEGAFPAFLQLI